MKWLDERKEFSSKKNGTIVCYRSIRTWGRWELFVQTFDETTRYTNTMWRRALKRVPQNAGIKNVLVLGMGAGGVLKLLRKRFPTCRITMVEWDPVMVDLAQQFCGWKNDPRVTVLVEDAQTAIAHLMTPFDLIIVDLFHGPDAPLFLQDETFLKTLRDKLQPHGYLLWNFFREPKFLESAQKNFSLFDVWRYRYNRVALLRPHGNGCLGDPRLENHIHKQQSVTNLESTCAGRKNFEIIRDHGPIGIRWSVGPFRFESYTGDIEPTIEREERARLVIWEPITCTDAPHGWWQPWINTGIRQTGTHESRIRKRIGNSGMNMPNAIANDGLQNNHILSRKLVWKK